MSTLELSRFMLALWVLLFHFGLLVNSVEAETALLSYTRIQKLTSLGFHAVPIFWMISGIVISHKYCNSFDLRQFAIARVARLVPLHYLTLLIVLFLQLLHSRLNGLDAIYTCCNDTKHFFLNLLMLHGLGLEDNYSFNGPSWSISSELFAYFLFAIMRQRFQFNQRNSLVVFMLFYLFTIFITATSLLYDIDPHKFSRLFASVAMFFLGSFLYFSFQNGRFKTLFATLLFTLSISIVAQLSEKTQLLLSINSMFLIPYMMLFIGILLKLENDVRITRNVLSKPMIIFLAKLGRLSFPLYLIHIPVQLAIVLLTKLLGITWSFLHLLALYSSVSLLMAVVINFFFEEPIRRKIIHNSQK
jgi:peptidoglycan/LPS O-acetylase OafA/YrhL